MKKVLIYLRVSYADQVEGNGLEIQRNGCNDYVRKLGYADEEIKWFVEEGQSAKTTDRDKLIEMMEYAKSHYKEIEALVVHKIDRLARNQTDYGSLKVYFNKLAIKVLSATENLTDTPVGRFIENSLANMAQFDNEVRAERCKGGMMEAVKEGRWVWIAPLGYRNGEVDGKSNLVIDEVSAPFIKRAFEMVAAEVYEPIEVKRILEKEGFRNNKGNMLAKNHFYAILRHKIYKGIIDVPSFELSVPGNYEPIISEELFATVQNIIDGKKSTKGIKYLKQHPDFPLRGLVFCADGHKLTASWTQGRSKKYGYYSCGKCKSINHDKEIMEEKFAAKLEEFEYSLDVSEMLRIAIETNWQKRNELLVKQRQFQVEQLASLQAKQEIIIDKNAKGVIPDDLAKQQLEKTSEEIQRLQGEMSQLKPQEEYVEEIVQYGLVFLEHLSGIWKDAGIDAQQRFQKFLFPEGVQFLGTEFANAKTPLILNTKKTLHDEESSVVDPRGIEPLKQPCQEVLCHQDWAHAKNYYTVILKKT